MQEVQTDMQVYISRNGDEFGPYTIEDVRTDLTSGCLLRSDLARLEGETEWVTLSTLEESFNTSRGGSAVSE